MKRTTVYFPDVMKAAIELQAARRGVTEAEVIRSAVEADLSRQANPKPKLPLFPAGFGQNLAGRAEELLEQMGREPAIEFDDIHQDADGDGVDL